MALFQPLKFTRSGHILIHSGDDPWAIALVLDAVSYREEFCLALDFSPAFIARLMTAGFLVMSVIPDDTGPGGAILLPEMHLERSVLFFDKLHESRSARRLIPRYELRVDGLGQETETGTGNGGLFLFDTVVERCAQVHGEDWLTPRLRRGFHALRKAQMPDTGDRENSAAGPRMVSFGLYQEGRLTAGEFGAAVGGVYTSYSGYKDENSSGTVQLIMTGRLLRDRGFAFWDLGMPLPYKERLGAQIVTRREFLERFHKARNKAAGKAQGETKGEAHDSRAGVF
ncbi:MAG: leucyl-tRNA--protein transferase [Treponema sp.]|jgi:Leu/Phe-tRNA-protein transferase|nr:leucyl-tRNA--protein transferase [Treponema sp.]